MITVSITLTTAGIDTGPTFNLYSNVDGYTTAFETGVAKASLVAGYISTLVPDGTTTIRVYSPGACQTSVDLTIITSTTTSTTSTSTSTTTTTSSTTTTTTTAAPGPTTTTTTTPPPHFKYYFQVRNQTDTVYGDGTFYLNPTGGSVSFTTDYSLDLISQTTFNPSGSSVVATSGFVIDRITKFDYDGTTVLYNLALGTPNYTFGTGPFTMNSIGTSPGQFQTIKVFTRPA